MQTCIWCLKSDPNVTFLKRAHTFPRSLGGRRTCENICDDCNYYFGTKQKGNPSVEVIFKEILNLSRHIILINNKNVKNLAPYKSEYFRFDKEKFTLNINTKYRFERSFQSKLGRLFKRGLYKVYLEEREREVGDSKDERFNFIREFARYDLNDPPVYYMLPTKGIMFLSQYDTRFYTIKFTPYVHEMDRIYRTHRLELYGHTFILPLSKSFEQFYLAEYLKYLRSQDWLLQGEGLIKINQINEIDFTHVNRFETKKHK